MVQVNSYWTPNGEQDMVKIQRVKAYKYKDHHIYKFKLNIPSDVLKKLGWDENTDVELKVKNKKLEITKL